ncbi:hypothetical protein [Kordia sp.]|uniref:hypothetical protein n=1 Tax=Kordia sp. TaxID=1965332 RepID=UPI0025B9DBBE|nr:hypothetical protein [Kordia sp.]MCH2194448.1 hypothetical protein [Kordia sp.]
MKVSSAPQVLVIPTSDFEVNHLHECFFALRTNSNPTIPTKYRMDLVVKNTVTNTFLNSKLELDTTDGSGSEFEDMARPVPPFGQDGYPSTDKKNFGVFLLSGIQ